MPDTPTPRAVLDIVLDSPNGRAIAAMYGAEFTARTLPSLVAEVIAALAASAGPLSAEQVTEWARLRERIESELSPSAKRCLNEWIGGLDTAYTALAADLAALRATVAAWRQVLCGNCGVTYQRSVPEAAIIGDESKHGIGRCGGGVIIARTPTREGQG